MCCFTGPPLYKQCQTSQPASFCFARVTPDTSVIVGPFSDQYLTVGRRLAFDLAVRPHRTSELLPIR